MPIDTNSRAFIEANIEYYREVTLAVKVFEAEVEAALRSIWREFKQQLTVAGLPSDDPSFAATMLDDASDMRLKTGLNTGIQIGIALQCRNGDNGSGRFAAYSWVWVKNTDLRMSLDNHVATHVSAPFVHEFEFSTTFISAYMDLGKKSEAIDLLRAGFRTLLECLVGSPEFRRSYNISGPVDTASSQG